MPKTKNNLTPGKKYTALNKERVVKRNRKKLNWKTMHSKTQVIVSSARNKTLKGIFDIYFKFFCKTTCQIVRKSI